MLSCAALLAGCVDEEPNYAKKPDSGNGTPTEVGYLSLSGLEMKVIYDGETETMPDDTAGASTRATTPQVDDFILEVVNARGESVASKSYAEWKAAERNELPVGSYTLKVRSQEQFPDVEWETPVYAASKDFVIEREQTTTLDDITCTLANIKVTMLYSADLADMLSDDTKAVISLGDKSMEFGKKETRAAYYLPEEELNTLEFQLTGSFADTGKPVTLNKSIPNVKAGQWRKITLVIEWADKGDVVFDIEVDNFVLDETVEVNGTDGLWEEVIGGDTPEDGPAIVWEGQELSQPFTLTDAMFDQTGNCTVPFRFKVTAPEGLTSLGVAIDSDNASLLEALDRIQLPRSFDLCTLDASSTAGAVLTSFGLPLGSLVTGQQALTLDITRQIPQLYTYAGTHTFTLTLGDATGKTTQTTLTLVVKKGGTQTGPVITWRGYNIDQSYDLTADMTIVVDIESENGIKAFEVNIDSEVLAPMLGAVGIPETFDLCTVDGALAETLQSFGFKTGSDVTSPMSFDITQFVSILMMMDAGEHQFHLAVTDDNGVTTRKTLHLINRK